MIDFYYKNRIPTARELGKLSRSTTCFKFTAKTERGYEYTHGLFTEVLSKYNGLSYNVIIYA